MKDDQRKGEGLRSDDGDDGLSFLLGLVFFSMVMVVDGGDRLPLVSLGFGINPQVSWGHGDGDDGERRRGSNH